MMEDSRVGWERRDLIRSSRERWRRVSTSAAMVWPEGERRERGLGYDLGAF